MPGVSFLFLTTEWACDKLFLTWCFDGANGASGGDVDGGAGGCAWVYVYVCVV